MSDASEDSGLILEGIESATCHQCGVQMDVLGVEPFQSFRCPECGTPFMVPARLGAFLLLAQIGRGGMGGVVFLARDESLDRNVAIKVMPASLGLDEAAVETFRREAQAAARLNHPNIGQVYAFGQDHGQPYIVMELLAGTNLDKMIKQQGTLDQGFAVRVALQVATGLRAADEAGLTHGDIKPENILFDDKMNAKLVDFGIASFANQQQGDGIWGTPYYIAPERVLRQKPDARSDMYCLGGTLYHALTGRPPFDGTTPSEVVRARLQEDPAPPGTLRPNIRPEIEAIVMRMLKREPSARHPTYASLIGDLTRASKLVPERLRSPDTGIIKPTKKPTLRVAPQSGRARTTGISAVDAKPTAPDQPRRGTGRVFKVLAVLVLLAGLIGGGIWLALKYRDKERQQQTDRSRAHNIEQAQNKAHEAWAAVSTSASNVLRSVTAASNCVATIVKSVEAVHQVKLEIPPPPPTTPPPAVPGTVATNGPAAAATNATPPAATNATPPAAVPAVDTGAVAAAAAPPEAPVKTEPDPEMVAAGKRALAVVREALDAAGTATRFMEEARGLHTAILSAQSTDTANSNLTALAKLVESCRALEPETKRKADDVKKLSQSLEDLRARREKEEAARLKRDAEAAERQRLEEQKRQAEADAKAAAEAERTAAKTLRTKLLAHVHAYTFKQAVTDANAEKGGYATPEGKTEWQRLADRYKSIAALHARLIGFINAKPFAWGWIQGAAQDIIAADETTVRTKGRSYPWTDVTARQYLHIVNHYLAKADIGAREQAELCLGAALYCLESVEGSENAKAIESAKNLAADFLRKARDSAPTINEDIQRILGREQP